MSEPISSERYVKQDGRECPVCGNDDLDYGSQDFHPGGMSQGVGCKECESDWLDVYTLTSYEDLDVHGKEREANFKRLDAELHQRMQQQS